MMNHTKVGMLIYLKENLPTIHILPILVVHSGRFLHNPEEEVNRVIVFSQGKPLIVRSSSVLEDTSAHSNAGKFESILNVMPAVDEIICDVNCGIIISALFLDRPFATMRRYDDMAKEPLHPEIIEKLYEVEIYRKRTFTLVYIRKLQD